MKKISNKQKKIKKELSKVYTEILNERGHYCCGCGQSNIPLSFSHIIPRSRRSDLICNKDNITLHCLTLDKKGCHEMWESRSERSKLLDYHKNMEYILEVDTEYYFLITE